MARRSIKGEVLATNADTSAQAGANAIKAELAKIDYTNEAGNMPVDREAFGKMLETIKVAAKEFNRISFIAGAAAVVLAIKEGKVDAMEEFLACLPDGWRKNSWRFYFQTLGPVSWDADRTITNAEGKEVKQAGFVMDKDRMKKAARTMAKDQPAFQGNLLRNAPWDMVKEAPYRADNLPDAVKRLAKAMKARQAKVEAAKADPKKALEMRASASELEKANFRGLAELEALSAAIN